MKTKMKMKVGLKDKKKCDTKNITPIEELTDDCLIYIFKHLVLIADRLNVGRGKNIFLYLNTYTHTYTSVEKNG